MDAFLPILVIIFMFGALGMLILGITSLARGGNPQRSNKLMQYRVLFQGLAIVAFLILMLFFRR